MVDMLIAQKERSNQTELVLDAINNLLLSIGYGQDFNYAYNIVVRRRWWLLLASLNLKADLDLLSSDLQFWKSIQMQNEIRELAVALRKIKKNNGASMINDMLTIVDTYNDANSHEYFK